MTFFAGPDVLGHARFLLEPVFLDTVWSEHLQLPVSEENERDALQDVADLASAALERFAAQGNSVPQRFGSVSGVDNKSVH